VWEGHVELLKSTFQFGIKFWKTLHTFVDDATFTKKFDDSEILKMFIGAKSQYLSQQNLDHVRNVCETSNYVFLKFLNLNYLVKLKNQKTIIGESSNY